MPLLPTCLVLATNFYAYEVIEEQQFQPFDLALTSTLFGSIPNVHLLVTKIIPGKSYKHLTVAFDILS